jgi:dihydroorotate dehydrogenase (fumarate)
MTLNTTYLGMTLRHPFILGASPVTGHLDQVRRAEDGSCAAIVMHSMFEEQITEVGAGRRQGFERAARDFGTNLAHFHQVETPLLGPQEYLEQIRRIKAAVSIPLIASLNGAGSDGWLDYGRLIEEAGANALELNVYTFATGVSESSLDIETRIETLVRQLKTRVRIPLAVKLSPFFTAFGHFAARLEAAGADGLVLFNRFYQPDVDIETLETLPNIRLSTSGELLLRLRWLGILSENLNLSLAATGGVAGIADGIKALLSGAHAVQIVSAALQQGPQYFHEMEQGLRAWMTRHRYESVESFRGSLRLRHLGDPMQIERAAYRQVLRSWSAPVG